MSENISKSFREISLMLPLLLSFFIESLFLNAFHYLDSKAIAKAIHRGIKTLVCILL
jgi:hypothetical protein